MFDAFGSRSTLICSDLTGKAVSTPAPAEFGRGTHICAPTFQGHCCDFRRLAGGLPCI